MDITLKNTINLYYSNYIKNNKNKLIYYFISAIFFSIIQTLGITFLLNKITPNKKDRIYIYLLILYFLHNSLNISDLNCVPWSVVCGQLYLAIIKLKNLSITSLAVIPLRGAASGQLVK